MRNKDGGGRLAKIVDALGKAEKKRAIAQTIVAATGLRLASVIGMLTLYDSFFPRYERPDYRITPGVRCYRTMNDPPRREEMFFTSDDAELKGYYYAADSAKGLVIVVHGLHSGADDYLPIIRYFVNNEYSVFAYDGRGTYDSGGDSTVGFCQSLADLDNALTFVECSPVLSGYKRFLFGHSCGGYAVTSVLELHKGISACAAIAPVNNCYTLILDKGKQYAGAFADEGLPKTFLNAYQEILFGKYAKCSGVRGINSVDIPVLIAHGVDDKIISFDGQSIISRKNEIFNPNVFYYVGTGLIGGHDSIWHSKRSEEYRRKVAADLKKLKDITGDEFSTSELMEFYSKVDNELYSEINYELMADILKTDVSAMK